MTRPKVDPDKRQRTAQACDSCKRRKQKCNGEKPCNTCTKRQLDCQYTASTLDHCGSQDGLGPPIKRRNVDDSPTMLKSPIEAGQGSTARRNSSLMTWNQLAESGAMSLGETIVMKPEHKYIGTGRPLLSTADGDFDGRSKVSNASVAADEAEVYHPQNRMLQDSTGRLLYIGDSATLSYLQWTRLIVENVSGPSDFTRDPRRHMIMENAISLPQDLRPTGILPDQRTANILVNSFFTNTAGFIEAFNKNSFLASVDECYKDPLSVTPSLLCLLYLVFAIGLVMAAPYPGSDEAAIIDKLRSERASRAELFFRSAKSLADPVSGFEDADFWSIQALLLMSLYMLAISKRNASYVCFGMAVRSAFALGLHREESMVLFQLEEQLERKNLWRTLFILDRFLSACLGRPTAISEEDCSTSAFVTPGDVPMSPLGICTDATHLEALGAAVKSCQVIGVTLKRVYSKRKISTAVGQEIAARLDTWNTELPLSLHWRRLMDEPMDSSHGIAILHVNLLHCHSVMLLTRPFFLCLLHKTAVGSESRNSKPWRPSYKMETFAQTCVEASQHTLVLAQAVLDDKYLPQCNPFVIHCVFAAALIVLSNEFASLYHNPDAQTSISSAISILRFCSQNDKQAERVLYIVESFHKANEQRTSAKRLYLPGRKIPILSTLSQNSNFDIMRHFFRLEQHEAIPATTTSTFSGEAGLVASAAPPISSMPMIPSAVQQSSPDENVSMNGGMTTTAGVAQGVDTASGCDSEFDLNSLWDGWINSSNAPTAIHPHHPSTFGSYGLGSSHIPPVGPSVMYPPSEFR
ncbi:fungal-specific transcription factor domain-containing protein [Xylaria sp. FL1777]|nr:fungal-specific transcription factor domain-containing protein [Xylaria sp. FL1777]